MLFYSFQRKATVPDTKLQISAVKDGAIFQIPVLIGAVGFQSEAFMPDSSRTEPGSWPEAGGGIKGGAIKDDFCFFIVSVAANKGLNIFQKSGKIKRTCM